MKQPHFYDVAHNFVHLCTKAVTSKEDWLKAIKRTYDLNNPKTKQAYEAIKRYQFLSIVRGRTMTYVSH